MVVIKLARGFAKKIKVLLLVSHACGGVARDAAEIDNITIFIHLLCLAGNDSMRHSWQHEVIAANWLALGFRTQLASVPSR